MLDFDLILRMVLLALYHAILDCYAKIVTLAIQQIPLVVWQGSVSWVRMGIILYVQA